MKQLIISVCILLALQACGGAPDRQADQSRVDDRDVAHAPEGAGSDGVQQERAVTLGLPAATDTSMTAPARRMKAEQAVSSPSSYQNPAPPVLHSAHYPAVVDRENYQAFDSHAIQRAGEQPVSTFSIDVDTGAYANVRRFLQQGSLPDRQAVRVEEMINYFSYDYPVPRGTDAPFNVMTELAPSPWNADTLLLHVGLQGYRVAREDLPAANLVFLVDVSGSMQSPDKLELLKAGLVLLVNQMDRDDRISLVVYAGASGIVLEPTPGDQKARIIGALQQLASGGSTNGAAGIEQAYRMAQQGFIEKGINRIILATDGDFNVGVTHFEGLKQMVEQYRKSGVALTTLGLGRGNYNDRLMEQLADAGNGNHAYIDSLNEANKVLVQQMSSTLETIAKDVKIQIEFNPAIVAEYRLIGYENRRLKRQDFNNDKVDAGEIGAGHSVTALYEISLQGSKGQYMDRLRYGADSVPSHKTDEIALLRLRYKQPAGTDSKLIERLIHNSPVARMESTSDDFRFAAAVAAFGQQLRGGEYLQQFDYDDILRLARTARGSDHAGYRGEFLQLVSLAKSLN